MNLCLLLSRILGSKKGPPPAPTYTISGTIVDGAAAGIEGVTVALTGDATDSTTTAADGTYSFTGVVDGSYTVTPTLANYAFTPASRAASVSGDDVAIDSMVGAFSFLDRSFAADTTGQKPADVTGTGVTVVDIAQVNGFTKALSTADTGSAHVYIDMGVNIDLSGNLRAQALLQCANGTADVLSIGLSEGAPYGAPNDVITFQLNEGANPDIYNMASIFNEVLSQTGNVSLGVNKTSGDWKYVRLEINFDASTCKATVLDSDNATVYMAEKTFNFTAVGSDPLLRYVRYQVDTSFTNNKCAHFWVGRITDDWPTP